MGIGDLPFHSSRGLSTRERYGHGHLGAKRMLDSVPIDTEASGQCAIDADMPKGMILARPI